MWLTVASCLRVFNTVQGSGMPNLRTKFEQHANVLKNPAAGLFRLSALFNTKRLSSLCAHDTYHWPKQLLPWIQMSRFSGDVLKLVTSKVKILILKVCYGNLDATAYLNFTFLIFTLSILIFSIFAFSIFTFSIFIFLYSLFIYFLFFSL